MTARTAASPDQRRLRGICGHWIGEEARHCLTTDGVRHFPSGYRCPAHTPRALQNLPEIPPGPGWSADAWTTPSPLSASALFDERAVASGRRRSSPHVYAAAKAAEADRKAQQHH